MKINITTCPQVKIEVEGIMQEDDPGAQMAVFAKIIAAVADHYAADKDGYLSALTRIALAMTGIAGPDALTFTTVSGVSGPYEKSRPLDEEKAKQYYDMGYSDPRAARVLGVRAQDIARWRAKKGLPVNRQRTILSDGKLCEKAIRLYEKGCSDGEIERQLGVNEGAARTWRLSMGLPSKHSAVPLKITRLGLEDQAMQMYREGSSDRHIASVTGVSMSAVRSWRVHYGLGKNEEN